MKREPEPRAHLVCEPMNPKSSTVTRPSAHPDDGEQQGVSSSRTASHLPALDGLRGLAILLVLAHNFAVVALPTGLFGKLVQLGLDIGWIGVQLFFVLSGFLITRILLQTQSSPHYFYSFFGRRVLRIFPLYYGALFVAFFVLPAIGFNPPALAHDREKQVWLWLYLSNWAQALGFQSQVFPHFWSLAIEEQFYLLWPLLVHRLNARQVLTLSVALVVLSLGARHTMLWHGAAAESVYTYTVCRMDALALGAAAAAWLQLPGVAERLVARRHLLAWCALIVWSAGLVVTKGYSRTTLSGQTFGYSALAVAFAMAVTAAVFRPAHEPASLWERALSAASLRSLGKYSYGMYVFHKPLHDWLGKPLLDHFGLTPRPSYLWAVGYVVVATLFTLSLAMVSYHLMEKHFLSMKRWFEPDAS